MELQSPSPESANIKHKSSQNVLPPYLDFNCVFITDNDNVYRWASNETFIFRIFKMLHQFAVFRVILDGITDINPVWQAVLRVDDIVEKKLQIYVKNTLVLYCVSTDSYEKIVPFIIGKYSRLILHGNITIYQLSPLATQYVDKIRVSARMEIPQEKYDNFALFMVRQTHGNYPCFTISRNETFTPEFDKKITRTFPFILYYPYKLLYQRS
uniref:Glycosyltransferase family 92 protein n=1 Tax=Panagrellus redivivus TaxID=6233 RepID=A0A7E4VSV0_PANRE